MNVKGSLSSFNFNGSVGTQTANNGILNESGLSTVVNTSDNVGYSCEWVINVTAGTVDIDLEAYANGSQPVYWQVDGGAQGHYNGDNVGFQFIRIATALGVGKHVIRHNATAQFYFRSVRYGGGTASIVTVPCPVALFQDNVANQTAGTVTSPVARWGTQVVTSNRINNVHPGFQFNVAGSFQGVDLISTAAGSGSSKSLSVAIDHGLACPIANYNLLTITTDLTLNNTVQAQTIATGLSAGSHVVEVLDGSFLLFYAVRVYNGSSLASSASSGAGTISVGDITNIADGDWLCLDQLDTEEVVKVVSHSGSGPYTLTLAVNLAKNHAAGVGARNFSPANTPTITTTTAPTFKGRLMALGDSLTHAAAKDTAGTFPASGYDLYDPRASYACMAAREAGWEFRAGATQGWTAANLVSDHAATSDSVKPADVYVILIGTNDFGSNVAVATYEANLETIIGQCKTAAPSGATIYVAKVFTATNVTTNAGGKTKADYNAQQVTAVANTQAATYIIQQIDLSTGLNVSGANVDIPDAVHPSIAGTTSAGTGGQNKMAANFLPYIQGGLLASAGFFGS